MKIYELNEDEPELIEVTGISEEPFPTDAETSYGWLNRFLIHSLISPESSAVPLTEGTAT